MDQETSVPKEVRDRARQLAAQAKSRGELIPKPCAVCGDEKVEMHHFDYLIPLEVIWLCKPHHVAVHSGMLQHSSAAREQLRQDSRPMVITLTITESKTLTADHMTAFADKARRLGLTPEQLLFDLITTAP